MTALLNNHKNPFHGVLPSPFGGRIHAKFAKPSFLNNLLSERTAGLGCSRQCKRHPDLPVSF